MDTPINVYVAFVFTSYSGLPLSNITSTLVAESLNVTSTVVGNSILFIDIPLSIHFF
nr:hypothetical protein [Clostridium puniceum]